MNDFFVYLIKCSAVCAVLYTFYMTVISRDRNFRINRFYLVGIILCSHILPCMYFPVNAPPNTTIVTNTEYFPDMAWTDDFVAEKETQKVSLQAIHIISAIYWLVFAFLLVRYMYFGLFLLRTICRNKYDRHDGFCLVRIEKQTPFSFFKYLFIDREKYKPDELRQVIEHEKVHIRELHSLDIILAELFSMLLWFNPFVFFLKNSIKANHEFQADSCLLKLGFNSISYQKLLFNEALQNQPIGFVSNFNCITIKKRIEMITDNKTRKFRKYKIFLTIAVVGIIVLFSAFKINTPVLTGNTEQTVIVQQKISNPPDILPIKKKNIEKIACGFGITWENPITKKTTTHKGVDFKADKGTPILAAADGIVKHARWDKGYGNNIRIQHDNTLLTLYAHLEGFNVKENQSVKKGDIIGYVGSTGYSTGPHLHYEVRKNGEYVNPADYYTY